MKPEKSNSRCEIGSDSIKDPVTRLRAYLFFSSNNQPLGPKAH